MKNNLNEQISNMKRLMLLNEQVNLNNLKSNYPKEALDVKTLFPKVSEQMPRLLDKSGWPSIKMSLALLKSGENLKGMESIKTEKEFNGVPSGSGVNVQGNRFIKKFTEMYGKPTISITTKDQGEGNNILPKQLKNKSGVLVWSPNESTGGTPDVFGDDGRGLFDPTKSYWSQELGTQRNGIWNIWVL